MCTFYDPSLVIVDDINIVTKCSASQRGRSTVSFVRSAFLANVLQEQVTSGRVVEAPADWQAGEEKKAQEKKPE
ncbi:unnamed protein product [Clonostachys solani]|uniref:Uncharacterized protein n=1 Tax=Clonostachys solani TaxID=160281 RepID=A0A9N9ZDB7_9HYPO|nr:unnamed protein product [Clonostachys solani]